MRLSSFFISTRTLESRAFAEYLAFESTLKRNIYIYIIDIHDRLCGGLRYIYIYIYDSYIQRWAVPYAVPAIAEVLTSCDSRYCSPVIHPSWWAIALLNRRKLSCELHWRTFGLSRAKPRKTSFACLCHAEHWPHTFPTRTCIYIYIYVLPPSDTWWTYIFRKRKDQVISYRWKKHQSYQTDKTPC